MGRAAPGELRAAAAPRKGRLAPGRQATRRGPAAHRSPRGVLRRWAAVRSVRKERARRRAGPDRWGRAAALRPGAVRSQPQLTHQRHLRQLQSVAAAARPAVGRAALGAAAADRTASLASAPLASDRMDSPHQERARSRRGLQGTHSPAVDRDRRSDLAPDHSPEGPTAQPVAVVTAERVPAGQQAFQWAPRMQPAAVHRRSNSTCY